MRLVAGANRFMSGLKLGRAHSLNGTEEATRGFTFKVLKRIENVEVQIRHEEATRGFTFKVLKRIGNVEVRIGHDDFVIEMNCRTNEFCQEGNDSL